MCYNSRVLNKLPPKEFVELDNIWRGQNYDSAVGEFNILLQDSPAFELMLNSSPCVTWVVDVRNLSYKFMSKNAKEVLGNDAEQFLHKGVSLVNEIAYKEDLPNIWKLKKQVWNFLLSLPAEKRNKYRFSTDYRIVKPDGSAVRVLEQNSVFK